MAKLPRWDMELVPTGGGPLVVRPSGDPGVAGAAAAGVGRAVSQTGAAITVEARDAERRTKALQRQTEASAYALEATQGYNELSTGLATEPDPDAWQPKFKEFTAGQRARLGAIGDDDVREASETWLNKQVALWDADVRTGAQKVRLKQSYDHLTALDADATARRDDSLVVPHLSAMVNAGHMDPQAANDYLGAKRREIRADLGKDAITANVDAMATVDLAGAVHYLNDPKTFDGLDLDPQAKLAFKHGLLGKLRVQEAAAAQEQARIDTIVERNGVEALADAWGRQLDFAARHAQMRAGELSAQDFEKAVQISERGPAAENHTKTYAELLRLQDGLARGTVEPAAVRQYAMAHADKLKPATVEAAIRTAAETYSPQSQAVREAVSRAERQFVQVTDNTLTMLMALNAGKDQVKSAEDQRAKQYRLVNYLEDELHEYVRANPQATREEIVKRGRQIEAFLRQKIESDEQQAVIDAWEKAAFAPPAAQPWGEVPFPSAPGVPAGLELVWPQLSDRERTEAIELLRLGCSADRIAEELRRAP